MYKIIRSVFFCFDPELVHKFSMKSLHIICSVPVLKYFISKICTPITAPTSFLGISFPNKIGLAAGFDKNASYLNELKALGFGCVEIGTVTPKPQPGNDKPRLFRLPDDKALINRMGFNNDGVDAMVEKLKKWHSMEENKSMIIGGNIGKNKITPNEDAWKDYVICCDALYDYVNYFVVNVSSPNTPGLRELQEKSALKKIFTELQQLRSTKAIAKPILLKIAPDLTQEQVDDVIALTLEIKIDGLVVSNTTLDRSNLSATSKIKAEQYGAGGLSGLPVKQRSTALVKYIHEKSQQKIPLIASGGIFTTDDAREKLNVGASLIQVWTGFIYEGPQIVSKIYKHL